MSQQKSLTMATKQPLWTKNYILAFISNMLIFYSFYMLVPILPFYVMNNLHLDESSTGVVLALYTVAALLIRPLSGFLVDKFSRKPLYLLCYALFAIVFAGYALTQIVAIFVILRVLHGFGFGLSTVSGSTIAIDVMPAERRGEGIGYFGLSYTFAQSLGPLTGFWLYNHYEFNVIFLIAFGFAFIGFLSILPISMPSLEMPKKAEVEEALSLDRFILLKGLPCILLLLLVGYGYGTLSNFIGIYCAQSSFNCDPGLFFLIFAAGVVVSRLLSAKAINDGKVISVALFGAVLIAAGYFALAYCSLSWLFILGSVAVGIGFGCVNPAFQSLLINLAPHNRRGTANATFYTFFDLGIGGGIALGGVIIEHFDFTLLLSSCAALILLGALHFKFRSAKYYELNKL
ncbi:MAG: MFS transporter [Rikenellaceae bacterium]